MFNAFAAKTLKYWWIALAAWGLTTLWATLAAPDWESVVTQGEFAFLPADSPSRLAEAQLKEAFPDADSGSSLLFLIEREEQQLEPSDLELVQERLFAVVNDVLQETNQPLESEAEQGKIVTQIAPTVPLLGRVLQSSDGQAALGLVQLSQGFLTEWTWDFVNRLEKRLAIEAKQGWPGGLQVYLVGGSVLGRDITEYRSQSAVWIQDYAGWIVVLLLLAVFRAPAVVLIPLITLLAAIKVSLGVLAYLADWQWIHLFDGIEVYVTVIAYGAGVDYSMFLIARYREELARRGSASEALSVSIEQTGGAIAASAFTEIAGIAMLVFASFGKLSQAGVAISLALFGMLLASLTLTPALLRLGGRWVFWPFIPKQSEASNSDATARKSLTERGWTQVAEWVTRRPGWILSCSLLLLALPAALGLWTYNQVSYGLIPELPRDSTTRTGMRALTEHFEPGSIAPVSILMINEQVDFTSLESEAAFEQWTDAIAAERKQLKVANVFSFSQPLGLTESPPEIAATPVVEELADEFTAFQASKFYIASEGKLANHATRLQLLLTIDPFSREAIDHVGDLSAQLASLLPDALADGTQLYVSGPTASLRAMKEVTRGDQKLLFPLIACVVLAVLMVLLRRWRISLFLIASVGLTFLVTLGVTWLVFRLWFGPNFAGLDWSVALLLFTVLMAVGADYNVLLITRADEEIARTAARRGVLRAIVNTGSVITACGIVMAGTFANLAVGGKLLSMRQLGFALAFGVLLDTFVIRSFVVPSFLLLLKKRERSPQRDQEGSAPQQHLPE